MLVYHAIASIILCDRPDAAEVQTPQSVPILSNQITWACISVERIEVKYLKFFCGPRVRNIVVRTIIGSVDPKVVKLSTLTLEKPFKGDVFDRTEVIPAVLSKIV